MSEILKWWASKHPPEHKLEGAKITVWDANL